MTRGIVGLICLDLLRVLQLEHDLDLEILRPLARLAGEIDQHLRHVDEAPAWAPRPRRRSPCFGVTASTGRTRRRRRRPAAAPRPPAMMISFCLLLRRCGAGGFSAVVLRFRRSAIDCPPGLLGRSIAAAAGRMTRYQCRQRASALVLPTLGSEWLMEPFFRRRAARKILPAIWSTNRYCRPRPPRRNTANHVEITQFHDWHGVRIAVGEPQLGRARRFARSAGRPGRAGSPFVKGSTTDGECCFSSDCRGRWRCERQIDVVANNIANVNTTGFKADKSLFQEFLTSGAHEDISRGRDRRVSFVQDRATWHDFEPGAAGADQEPARRRHRRRRLPGGADPGAASATPATARCRSTQQGQLVTAERQSGARQRRADRVPARRQGNQHHRRRRISVSEGANTRRLAARQAAAGVASPTRRACRRKAPTCSPAADGAAAVPDRTAQVRQGSIEKSNVNAVVEMSRHDRGHPHLHADLGDAAAAGRPAPNRDRKTRRSSGLRDNRPCAHSTPQRPE